jgi:hypothetical protein
MKVLSQTDGFPDACRVRTPLGRLGTLSLSSFHTLDPDDSDAAGAVI